MSQKCQKTKLGFVGWDGVVNGGRIGFRAARCPRRGPGCIHVCATWSQSVSPEGSVVRNATEVGRWLDGQSVASDISNRLALVLFPLLDSFMDIAEESAHAAWRVKVDGEHGPGFSSSVGEWVRRFADQRIRSALGQCGEVKIVAMEGDGAPSIVGEQSASCTIAVVDPLNAGSSLEVGGSCSSMFGIFQMNLSCLTSDVTTKLNEEEIACVYATLQPGSNLLLAGYCLYGAATTLVLTVGSGVTGFTLDRQSRQFRLSHPNIKIPRRGAVYSFNESRSPHWNKTVVELIEMLKLGRSGTAFSARYAGSLATDVHRVLVSGGIFGYPPDRHQSLGKLRLLFNGAPLAWIIEQAGGIATTGKERVLDIIPTSMGQRIPLFLGSHDDMQEFLKIYSPEPFEGMPNY